MKINVYLDIDSQGTVSLGALKCFSSPLLFLLCEYEQRTNYNKIMRIESNEEFIYYLINNMRASDYHDLIKFFNMKNEEYDMYSFELVFV